MMPATPLDAAFVAAEADPDPALRLRFHERVLDAELAVALAEAAGAGGSLSPRVFELEEGRFVLAFDRDERLADFFGAPTEYVALTGRRLAALLAGQGIGIALNLGAPSAALLPAESVDWLAAMVAAPPQPRETRLAGLAEPEVAPALRLALAAKLAAMADAVAEARLVAVAEEGGGVGVALVLSGVPVDARAGVAAAVAEAVRFTEGAPEIDVAFLDGDSAAAAEVARVGLRLALPEPEGPAAGVGPGMDPKRPPRLR